MDTSAMAISTVLLGVSVAACGGGDSASTAYCQDVKAAQSTFGGATDRGSLAAAFMTFHELAAGAPEAVADDWRTLDGAFTDLRTAFTQAGVDVSQEGAVEDAISDGTIPVATLTRLTSSEVVEARVAIEKHATSLCDVDISGS